MKTFYCRIYFDSKVSSFVSSTDNFDHVIDVIKDVCGSSLKRIEFYVLSRSYEFKSEDVSHD